jgi:hypothetical protein
MMLHKMMAEKNKNAVKNEFKLYFRYTLRLFLKAFIFFMSSFLPNLFKIKYESVRTSNLRYAVVVFLIGFVYFSSLQDWEYLLWISEVIL